MPRKKSSLLLIPFILKLLTDLVSPEKLSTNFIDALSFSGNYKGFKIQSIDPNSCFKAKAVPKTDQNTWFEIDLNNDTEEVSKTCGDSSKPGCDEGNTW